jgi:hypothetical protein
MALGLRLGITHNLGVAVLVSGQTWSSQAEGVASFGAGLSLLRASDAGYETTTGYQPSVGGSNIGRIATYAGVKGLRIEGATDDELSGTNASDVSSWGTFGGATIGSAITGPDGTASARRVTSPSSGTIFISQGALSGGRRSVSFWCKIVDPLKTTVQVQVFDGGSHAGTATLAASGWVQRSVELTSSNTAGAFLSLLDARDWSGPGIGGIAAQAQEADVAMIQWEAGPASTWTATARSAEVLLDTASAASLNGRVRIDVTWVPDVSAASAVTWARTEMVIAWIDDANYVAVDTARRQIRLVVDGVRVQLPGVLPAWAAGDTFAFSLSPLGGGLPSGTYTRNGGAAVSLGIGLALPALRTQTDTTIAWFARGLTSATATQQLQGLIAAEPTA